MEFKDKHKATIDTNKKKTLLTHSHLCNTPNLPTLKIYVFNIQNL